MAEILKDVLPTYSLIFKKKKSHNSHTVLYINIASLCILVYSVLTVRDSRMFTFLVHKDTVHVVHSSVKCIRLSRRRDSG